MAFITTSTYTNPAHDLGSLVARLRDGFKRLPLGEERFTGSAHQPRVSETGPEGRGASASYRPTYALQVV